jgi:hypothetical protein
MGIDRATSRARFRLSPPDTLKFRFSGGCHNSMTERLKDPDSCIASDYNDGETFCIRHHHHRGGNASGDSGTGLWLLSGLVPARSRTLNCPNWTSNGPNKLKQRHARSHGKLYRGLSCCTLTTCHLGMFAEWDHTTKNALPRLRSRSHSPYDPRLLTIFPKRCRQ